MPKLSSSNVRWARFRGETYLEWISLVVVEGITGGPWMTCQSCASVALVIVKVIVGTKAV